MTRSPPDHRATTTYVGRAEIFRRALAHALDAPPAEVLEQVATLLARKGPGNAFTIKADNDRNQTFDVRTSVMTGQAFAVWVRKHVFFEDIDFGRACTNNPGLSRKEVEEKIATHLLHSMWAIKMAGAVPLVCASGRESSFHLFAVGITPETAERILEDARAQGLLDCFHVPGEPEKAIRPPGAPHRSGATYSRPLFVEDWDDVLKVFDVPHQGIELAPRPHAWGRPSTTALANPLPGRPRRTVGPAYQVLIDTGDLDAFVRAGGRLGKRPDLTASGILARIVVHALNCGHDFESFLQIIDFGNAAGARKVLERHDHRPQAAESWLVQDWNRHVEFVRAHPPRRTASRAMKGIDELEAAVSARTWGGRGEATQQAVIYAMIKVARKTGKMVFHASLREIGEEVNIQCPKTVSKALNELTRKGMVEPVGLRLDLDLGGARRWRLLAPPRSPRPPSALPPRGCGDECGFTLRRPTHELWCSAGLGLTGKQTWEALGELGPSTTDILGLHLGLKGPALRQRLRHLQDAGMVTNVGRGRTSVWAPAPGVDLDAIAAMLGVTGTAERLKAKHKRERQQFERGRREAEGGRQGPLSAVKGGRQRHLPVELWQRGGQPQEGPSPSPSPVEEMAVAASLSVPPAPRPETPAPAARRARRATSRFAASTAPRSASLSRRPTSPAPMTGSC